MGRSGRGALGSLHRGIQRCRQCRLHAGRTHAVPGEGPSDARLLFVGEAPGEREDEEGRPFRGRCGGFLDDLLASVGIPRGGVYVTSSVKCRPPGNRDPRADELRTCCGAWLERQIGIVDPRLVVLLGRVAVKQVLADPGPLRDLHGEVRRVGGRSYLPTYHPAAGMRFPDVEPRMRSDFAEIPSEIGN